MMIEYINERLKKAKYEIIDDDEGYYGHIPALRGVWATGKTLEACRDELASVLEGWMILHFKKNIPLPGFKLPRVEIRKERAYA